ncbi:PP2C family protein-serine/threonine phosphatase [Streptomyces sp. NPDC127108]|uniref:PP2C family protein-serine/threonine phosphatase n=1 Tax=Streptomyces sp. NPDC127108 TaxID=3345361 RepID=UPI0036323ABA
MRRDSGTPTEQSAARAVSAALQSAPWPLLLAGADGRVRWLNPAATALLPGVGAGTSLARHAPSWLADAHARRDRAAAGAVAGRALRAEAAPADGAEAVLWWLRDDPDPHTAPDAERERARLLADVSDELFARLNPQECRGSTARLAARHLADAAVVVGAGRGARPPVAAARRDGEVTHGRLAGDPADVPGLAEALQGFPPVPARWLDPAALPSWMLPEAFELPEAFQGRGSDSVNAPDSVDTPDPTGARGGSGASGASEPPGALMVTPLPGRGTPIGALVLMRRAGAQPFTEDDEALARLFAVRAAAALSAATLHAEQTAVADLLTQDTLRPGPRRVDGVEYAVGHRPADGELGVGGDFVDISTAPEAGGETHVVLGDVCGKGLEAAALTGKIRTTLRALHLLEPDHQRLLRALNAALLGTDDSRFATLVLASVSRRGSAVALRLTSAGHPPPLIVRRDGDVLAAPTHGTLVGALPEVSTQTYETTLRPGEACLLYSDGVTEAKGGPLGTDQFGEERLRAALAECAGHPPEAIAERVQMLVADWLGGRRHDDIGLVVIAAPRRRTHLTAAPAL